MRTSKTKHLAPHVAGPSVLFSIPLAHIPLSKYAEMTGQTLRAVQQQANEGKFILTQERYGKEREINMVAESMRAHAEAVLALSSLNLL